MTKLPQCLIIEALPQALQTAVADYSQLFEQISDAKENELPWRKYAYYMKWEDMFYSTFKGTLTVMRRHNFCWTKIFQYKNKKFIVQ